MIHRIHTACKDCIFVIPNTATQTGCSADVSGKDGGLIETALDTLRKNGVEILEAYDEKKEFYIVNGQKCLHKRTKKWLHNIAQKGHNLHKKWIDIINKEIELKYQVIIVANNTIGDIKNTVDSITQQTLPPQHISIIRKQDNPIRPRTLVEMLQATGIKWRVENMIDQAIKINNHVDIIMDFKPHPYYMVVNAGFMVPSDTFRIISDKFISRELQCLALSPNKDGNGFFTSHSVHKMCQGNKSVALIEKLTQDKLCQPLLKQITEVVPNFPV